MVAATPESTHAASPTQPPSLADFASELLPTAIARTGSAIEVLPDIALFQTVMVNLYMVGHPGSSDWVLVDAGLPLFANKIIQAAEQRFGPGTSPKAIILTHGHFDHVGSLRALLDRWPVPVYAHVLELPYLTGRSDYPPPDPTVGGGLMARTAKLLPWSAINLGGHATPLPPDNSVPHMPGWRWVHTPGHTPGHVSLFRDADRTLIAGDAFITQKQESLIGVMTQHQMMHGPPAYFTTDWNAAGASVRKLAELEPALAVTGHGIPISGPPLTQGLHCLADHFGEIATPPDGRYVRQPATADATGVTSVPPPIPDPVPKIAAGIAIAAAVGIALATTRRRD
jgi:glyoxylase-like metal-dependent hydrolase (beta-lactamase superfamily II)